MNKHPNIDLHDDLVWGKDGGRASDVPPIGWANPLEDEPLAPNRADIAKHLYALFAPSFVQPHPDSWIEIAYGDPAVGEGKVNNAAHFSPFELEAAIGFAERQNRAGFNVYVGAALRYGERPNGRSNGSHVLAASHTWFEYDGAGDDGRVAAILKDKGLTPAIVVMTGTTPCPRRHLYLRVDGSANPDDIRAANAALKKLLGTDAVQNPDRVMRLAGTVSYPPPDKRDNRGYITELVTLHQPRDARAYSLDELIGLAPEGQRKGYNESEEKPAPTVESFFKDVNALALCRLSHWVKPLFGQLIKFYPATGCWRTIPEANKTLAGRAHLEETISISQRGVWDYGHEEGSDPIELVIDYGPRSSLSPFTAKDAAFWLCERMAIAPEALGWGTRDRRSAEDAGYEEGYDFGTAGAQPSDKTAPKEPLKFIDMSLWDSIPVPPRQWAVRDRIPIHQVTLLSGEGGAGKSIIEMQLCAAHVLERDWFGSLPEPGPAIYQSCEDTEGELHRRLASVCAHYDVKFADLINGGLNMFSCAEGDGVLAVPTKSGQMEPTKLYNQLMEAAKDIKPKHIGIDTSADVFGGNEIDRAQVRQFVGMLRKMAIAANGSVVLLSHPSLTGINSGSGISGSTAWFNSVRSHIYLKAEGDTRTLEFKKNQYGPLGERVVVRYEDGIFVPDGGKTDVELALINKLADDKFLELLDITAGQQRFYGAKKGPNYAPTQFAALPQAGGYTAHTLVAAMERLLGAERIKLVLNPTVKPSKATLVLVRGGK